MSWSTAGMAILGRVILDALGAILERRRARLEDKREVRRILAEIETERLNEKLRQRAAKGRRRNG